jgi:hypothetical protein
MQAVKVEPINLRKWSIRPVREIRAGRFSEVTYTEREARLVTRRLSKTEYLDLRTGEVKQYNLNTEKQAANIRESMFNLRNIIRCNFDGEENHTQKLITLTYPNPDNANPMRDSEKLMKDYELFWKQLKYHYRKTHKLEYVAVAEPQKDGAWHMHVMVKADSDIMIPWQSVRDWWGQGDRATRVEALRGRDQGRYYEAYFTNLAATGGQEDHIAGEDGQDESRFDSKAAVKGGRLRFYPVGMRFFRCSRGIKRPTDGYRDYGAIVDDMGIAVHKVAWQIQDEYGEPMQFVQKESFEKEGGSKDAPEQ